MTTSSSSKTSISPTALSSSKTSSSSTTSSSSKTSSSTSSTTATSSDPASSFIATSTIAACTATTPCTSLLGTTIYSTTTTFTVTAPTTLTQVLITGTNVFTASALTTTLPYITVTAAVPVTVTATADAVTTSLPTSTITASPIASTTTRVATITTCGIATRDKRTVIAENSSTLAGSSPKSTSPMISTGCSCLILPTSTTTTFSTTITVTESVTMTSDVAGVMTLYPTITLNPSITPNSTVSTTITPTSTVIQYTTITPVTTVSVLSTTTIVVGQVTGTPTVALASPTAIAGNSDGDSSSEYDDESFSVDIPFPIEFYGVSASTVVVSVNGWISLLGTYGSYENSGLPSSRLPDTSLAPFWTDLYISSGTPQGIYYEVEGQSPNRNITFEWYTSIGDVSDMYYHFLVMFQENTPNTVTYTYLDVSDDGSGATVGAQSLTAGKSSQYSYDTADITPGLQLVFNTASNTFDVASEVSCAA